MTALLAALCGLAAFAALRDLWVDRGPALVRVAGRAKARALGGLPAPLRGPALGRGAERTLKRAGVAHLDPRLVAAARLTCLACAVPLAASLAPAAPGRSGLLVLAGLPAATSFLPIVVLDRFARLRAARIAAALPDALEVMALQAGAGGGHRTLLRAGAEAGRGALADELRLTVAEVECGVPSGAALRSLRERVGGEVAAVVQVLERSRRLGSPLAGALQDQALGLRERRARGIEEAAARAAPKIQLVVALLLVPSVLLLVAAAILANADALLTGF